MNVIVTGASRGIGLELTKQALERGGQVLAVARQPKASNGLNELARAYPQLLQTFAADVEQAGCPQKIGEACKDWNHVDLLINNAGLFAKNESPQDFQQSFTVNSVAPFLISQTLLPKLRNSKAAKIAQITSRMGSIADNSSGGSYAYRASKAALNMLNKCMAAENGWLTTVVLHPGWVKTDMGGAGAQVEIADSAKGLWRVIDSLKSTDSGKFFDFRGEEIPW